MTTEDDDNIHTIKVVLLGNGSTGKTSLISRYCQETYDDSYLQTIGLDFFLKRLDLPDGSHATLQLWDIGGQSIGGKMMSSYLEKADCVLYVYDITDRDSFDSLLDWHSVVTKVFEGQPQPTIGVIANKLDLKHQRAVPISDHNELIEEHKWLSFETSAKRATNIDLMFRTVVAKLTGVQVTKEEFESARAKPFIASIQRGASNTNGRETSLQAPKKPTKVLEKSSFCTIS